MSSMTNDNEKDNVKDILKLYLQYFNGFLQETLKKYCSIVEKDCARSELGGASLGATAASVTELAISPAEKVAPALVQFAVDLFKLKKARDKAASLVDVICMAKLEDPHMRRVIALACFEIVRSYEEIFVQVSAGNKRLAAIIILADEAATAVIEHLIEAGAGSRLSADTFLDAVKAINPEVSGNVFVRTITKVYTSVRSFAKGTTDKLTLADGKKVSASKLYSQVGLVDHDGTSYILKGRKQCNTYRYRRIFSSESIDDKDYVIEKNHACKNYQYIFDIWCQEDIIKELMNEFDKTKDDVVDEIKKKVDEMAVNVVKDIENIRQQPKGNEQSAATVTISDTNAEEWDQTINQTTRGKDSTVNITKTVLTKNWNQIINQ